MKTQLLIRCSLVVISIIGCASFESVAQKRNQKLFVKSAKQFMEAFEARDVGELVKVYADTVVYRDQVYGSVDRFSRVDLQKMFGPFFTGPAEWDFDISAKAYDTENQMLMIKLDFPALVDKDMGEYAGWFRFEEGKIVEQLDFSMYPIGDILKSPTFVRYFEKENLEVKEKSSSILNRLSESFVKAINDGNLNEMMSHYGDTIHYVDPIWGADDIFARSTVRSFYEPMFTAESTADVKVLTIALDEKEDAMILKGSSYDTTEKGRLPFAVYFRFENGKIVEQMDFPVYAVESLRASPRYRPFMK